MATIADRISKPWLAVRIVGVGPDTDAAGANERYAFASMADPGVVIGTWWRPYLVDVPEGTESQLDPVTGEVSVGSLTVDLIEGPGTAFMTELMAVRERSLRGELAASITAAALTMDVYRRAGGAPTVNRVLSIGAERMRITAVAAGAGVGGSDRLTVSRGWYATEAAAHTVASDHGDAEVRYRAHFMRGRLVELYQGFHGDAIPTTPVAAYILAGIEVVDGSVWRLTLTGVESLLDTEILTHAWVGRGANPFSPQRMDQAPVDRDAFDGRHLRVIGYYEGSPALPDAEGPENLRADASLGGYVRLGDACVEYDHPVGFAFLRVKSINVTAWRVARTPLPTADETYIPMREVWPTDKALAHSRFRPDPAGAAPAKASDHPIDIFLCMVLSTGLGTNVGAGQTNYDVLPGPDWGAVPVARVDVAAWEAIKLTRSPGIRCPNLVVGWDGPLNLAAFAREHLLGPLGIAAVQDAAGRIGPVRIEDTFPGETVTALDGDDIIPGSETWSWDWADQVTSQVWEWDQAGPDGDPLQVHVVTSPEARVRHRRGDDRPLTMKASGYTRESGGLALVLERGDFLRRHFVEPPPTVTVLLNWQHMHLSTGAHVTLTLASLPNPATGTRGVTAQPFLVLAVRRRWRDLVGSDARGGGVEVTLFWTGLDAATLGLYAPSAIVAAADAGVGVVVTVERNEFTNGITTGSVPADDTGGFQAGAIGTSDLVILLDADGVSRAANTPRVTATTATTITLSDVFRTGFGLEVGRVPGNVITLCGDTGASSYPASAWTTRMQQHGAFSDVTNLTIGTTSRTTHYGA